jgi:hypothetical protein
MMTARKHTPAVYLALLAVLLATAALHLKTMDNDHRWWGDFALYIMHAKNIATGQPYTETGFIYSPSGNQGYSPPAYAPVYPAMLAPVYKLFGLNLYALKALNLVIFIVCLAVFFRFFTNSLSFNFSHLAVIAMIAFSPWFWMMRNLILSDIPFLLITLIALIIMDRLTATKQQQTAYWLLSVLLGLVIYASYGTRVLGLLLLPTVILYDLFRNRTIRIGPLLTIGIFLILHQLQTHLLDFSLDQSYSRVIADLTPQKAATPSETWLSGFLSLTRGMLSNMIWNAKLYSVVWVNHWDNGVSLTARLAIAVISSVFALTGFIHSCRSRLHPMDIFVVLYIGALMAVPVAQGFRYLLPVLPAGLLYSCMGAELLERRLIGDTARGLLIPGTLLAFALVSYAGNYHFIQDKNAYFGVMDKDSKELFEYIRNNTAPNSNIESSRPRIIALFTGRKSSYCNLWLPTDEIMDDFQHTGATHLLLYKGDEEWAYKNSFSKLLTEKADYLKAIFENENFRLYKIVYHNKAVH